MKQAKLAVAVVALWTRWSTTAVAGVVAVVVIQCWVEELVAVVVVVLWRYRMKSSQRRLPKQQQPERESEQHLQKQLARRWALELVGIVRSP